MRKSALLILAALLPFGVAHAAPLKEGRSVADPTGGYVRPAGKNMRAPQHAARGHATHYANLVGDPGSGLGFYNLPYTYRLGAWREHQREAYARYPNPVLSAMAADAARYYGSGIPGDRGYRYGVFNPDDGVGTPFFAGFYGPAGDENDPPTPFGRPYSW